MKKLEKLKLHDLEEICVEEQMALKGGGEWVTGPDGVQYWCVGEVEVASYTGCTCAACEEFRNHNENNSLGGVDGEPVMTPFGEFIANTLPHILGIGAHGGSDIYRYRVDGSGWTQWYN
jgi:hypothetical protein